MFDRQFPIILAIGKSIFPCVGGHTEYLLQVSIAVRIFRLIPANKNWDDGQRAHQTLDYKTPMQVEQEYRLVA